MQKTLCINLNFNLNNLPATIEKDYCECLYRDIISLINEKNVLVFNGGWCFYPSVTSSSYELIKNNKNETV